MKTEALICLLNYSQKTITIKGVKSGHSDFRTVSFHGFSTVLIDFSFNSSDIVLPMTLKFVERVVMPPDTTSLRGVSL